MILQINYYKFFYKNVMNYELTIHPITPSS